MGQKFPHGVIYDGQHFYPLDADGQIVPGASPVRPEPRTLTMEGLQHQARLLGIATEGMSVDEVFDAILEAGGFPGN